MGGAHSGGSEKRRNPWEGELTWEVCVGLVVGKQPSLMMSEPMIREQHGGGFPSRVSIVLSHSTSEGTEAKDPEGGV